MSGGTASSGRSGLLERLLGWLPGWLGFVLIILAGIVAIVVGAITPDVGFIALGVAAIASAVLAWWNGAGSQPRIDPSDRSFGGYVSGLDGWVWLVILGLFIVAVVIFFVT
jgi:multisubunit Na+/H+ antiporter MnhB subunit